jgi:membrane-bound metal-dependent hydrolase YbcI (DUF457 family)
VFAALWPDIDHLGSTLGRRAKWLVLVIWMAVVAAMATMGARLPVERLSILLAVLGYYVASLFGGHRSPWTHSIWPWLGGTVGSMVLASWLRMDLPWSDGAMDIGLAFAFGYGSHLLLDSFTRQGIPLLWPWIGRNIGLRLVTTGGASETIVVAICMGIAAVPLLM